MSEIFSLRVTGFAGWDPASGADYVCFKVTGGFRKWSPSGAFKIFSWACATQNELDLSRQVGCRVLITFF